MQIRNFDSLLNAKLLRTAALVASFVVSTALQAAPDEIVVFTDEFEKKGEVGYELHLNYAARARAGHRIIQASKRRIACSV